MLTISKPLSAGQASIGVRFNKVHWFQGAIRQIRVTPTVLKPDQAQQRRRVGLQRRGLEMLVDKVEPG